MKRRTFLTSTAAATGLLSSTAGCLSSADGGSSNLMLGSLADRPAVDSEFFERRSSVQRVFLEATTGVKYGVTDSTTDWVRLPVGGAVEAPKTSELAAGELAVGFDDESGAFELRAKDANGTEYEASVSGQQVSGIPTSAVLRFPFGQRSGSALNETLQNADGTANGLTNASGTWIKNYAEKGDGADDYGDLGDWSGVNFGRNLDDAGIIFTIQTTSTAVGVSPYGLYNGSGMRFWSMVNANGNSNLTVLAADNTSSVNDIIVDGNFNDGSKKRVALRFPSDDANDYRAFVNGQEKSITVDSNNASAANFANFNDPIYSHALNETGTSSRHFGGTIDEIVPCLGGPSKSEVTLDYDRQPWS